MREKIWQYKNEKLKRADIEATAKALHIPPIFVTILLNRGIAKEDMLPFLQKSMKNVINPMVMTDMDKAAARIKSAIDNKEKIVIYGDYDVDGITSTALLYDFLSSIGAEVDYYIPDRKGEGYGINIMAVNKLIKQGTKLLITVDCGITAIGEVEFAALQGMDVIITDHHTCKERIPTAAKAIVNPKRDDEYPFKELAGVGVTFKLVLAVAIELGMNTNQCFNKYIDLAAIGTVADVVPLIDENRIIVDRGVKAIQESPRIGIKALLNQSGNQPQSVTASSIAFIIAPRLNASGRLGSAETSVKLLLSKDIKEAEQIAKELDEQNRERQITEQKILNEAMELIQKDPNFEKKKVIVLAHEDWHHGVIGIVASKICEKFYKPCILISHSNGIGKGSGRSIDSFNLFDALSHCEDMLTQFGGHKIAAGLTINISELDGFITKINKYADENLTPKDLVPRVKIDCPVSEQALTSENAALLSKLEPFGVGNEKPVFSLSGAEIISINAVGNENRHLRLTIQRGSLKITCIGFSLGEYAGVFRCGDVVNIAFQMDINTYKGNENVQLILKDIKRG